MFAGAVTSEAAHPWSIGGQHCSVRTHAQSQRAVLVQITRLGEYASELEAAHAYDAAVRKMVGSHGEVNFDLEGKPVVKAPPGGNKPAPGVPLNPREQHNARRREKRRLANLAKYAPNLPQALDSANCRTRGITAACGCCLPALQLMVEVSARAVRWMSPPPDWGASTEPAPQHQPVAAV